METIYREDLDAIPLTDDYLLSDDIWKQFQIEEMQQQSLPIIDIVTCSMLCQEDCISSVENDCMWNGHYGKRMWNKSVTPPPGDDATKAPATQVAQQSVLKPAFNRMSVDPNSVVPMTPTYHFSIQTPPISDDEDTKPITQTLQVLQSVIGESYIEDDDDLSDYFKGEGDDEDFCVFDEEIEEEEEEEEDSKDQVMKQAEQMRAFYAAESDHSYHKGNHHAMRSPNLGIDTPSDSEEEIDVVSCSDKLVVTKVVGALPTNPSTKDRRQLQRTMQSRFPQGIKTVTPAKRGPTPGPSKPRTPERAPARATGGSSRQYKRANQSHHRQYKRRCTYGHSSDSEQEPSEKRNLHNNMERQRRIDLRNLFNDLKKLVPEVNKKQRAAKVLILRGAAQYCRELTATNEAYERRVDYLRKQQVRFRAELSKLRRDFAANR